MSALPAGVQAPEFSLPAITGKDGQTDGHFSLREGLKEGAVLVAFFKVSCPTCQYTFPFLERLHRLHGDKKIKIVGISQNDQRDTAAFAREFGVTFPMLLDDPNGYAVSNAYGLTNVPSLFLIRPDGKIEISSVGWLKQDIEEVNRRLAATREAPPAPLFKAGEDVRDFRAG